MEHYIQTRGYATAPEAPIIGDNDSKDTTEEQREVTENNLKRRNSDRSWKKLAIVGVGAGVCLFRRQT